MSGQFPTDIRIVKHTIQSQQQTLISVGQSFKTQSRSKNTQQWKISLHTVPLTRPQWMKLLAFFNQQKGRYDTFTIIPKIFTGPLGTGSGTPLVNGGSQTGGSIITDGWAHSQTVLIAGDLLKFAGSTKVYQVLADVISDSSGNATLSLCPQLLASPADNEALVINQVPFTVTFANDLMSLDVDEIMFSGAQVQLEERF